MHVFFFRVRAKTPDAADDICRVFRHTLSLFLEPGLQLGRCVVNLTDPRDVLIFEEWGNKAALQAWLTSKARQEAHQQLAPYIIGEPEESIFEEL
jgi:quinol monooxygenase YgiN